VAGEGHQDEPWLTDERLRLYPGAIFVAMVLAFAFALLTADGVTTATGTLGGDFPAFYAAGEIVARGDSAHLYEWEVQAAAQTGLHPDEPNSFLAFAYPPFVALAYAAFTLIGFVPGYVLHTLLMGGALFGAVWLVRPMLGSTQRHTLAAFVSVLAFYPMYRAVTGAQNTALSALLIVATWRLLHDRRDALAGIPLGLLLYKPQLGLPLIGLVALTRRVAVLPSLLATAAVLYLAGASVGGLNWLGWWWSQIARFHQMDQDVNAGNSVGILGAVEAALGPGEPVALAIGGLGTLVLVGFLMERWAMDRMTLSARMGLTAAALVLVPPHAMFYDAGLAALGWLVLVDRLGMAHVRTLGLLWVAALSAPLSMLVGINPLVLVVLAIVAVSARAEAP
jgi:hypothetical protein